MTKMFLSALSNTTGIYNMVKQNKTEYNYGFGKTT